LRAKNAPSRMLRPTPKKPFGTSERATKKSSRPTIGYVAGVSLKAGAF